MKEYAGFVSKVNLDGKDGCAEIDVRCKVPVETARRLAGFMLQGSVVRVCFPSGVPATGTEKEG